MRQADEVGDGEQIQSPAPKTFDIFAGVPMEDLPKAATRMVEATQVPTIATLRATKRDQPPLNRLMAKYPRLLLYVVIAVAALVVGLFVGIKVAPH